MGFITMKIMQPPDDKGFDLMSRPSGLFFFALRGHGYPLRVMGLP